MTKLALEFKKMQNDDNSVYSTFYSNLKAETTINKSHIDDLFVTIYSNIIILYKKSLGQDSGWIIDSVRDHNINISKVYSLSW